MVVDFPAPFGPMNPSSSPGSISKLSPRTASTVEYSGLNSARKLPPSPAAFRLDWKVLQRLETVMAGMAILYRMLRRIGFTATLNFDDHLAASLFHHLSDPFPGWLRASDCGANTCPDLDPAPNGQATTGIHLHAFLPCHADRAAPQHPDCHIHPCHVSIGHAACPKICFSRATRQPGSF
jgi:hypothetical protein